MKINTNFGNIPITMLTGGIKTPDNIEEKNNNANNINLTQIVILKKMRSIKIKFNKKNECIINVK